MAEIARADTDDAGTYRLRRREDEALFGYNVGPAVLEKVPVPGIQHAVAGGPG